jgi:hypothetical protein
MEDIAHVFIARLRIIESTQGIITSFVTKLLSFSITEQSYKIVGKGCCEERFDGMKMAIICYKQMCMACSGLGRSYYVIGAFS